jgi:hypothetical protein
MSRQGHRALVLPAKYPTFFDWFRRTLRPRVQTFLCHFIVEGGQHSMRLFRCPPWQMENRILEKQI